MTLHSQLNRLFAPDRQERKPAVHVVDGIPVTKINGLWTATVRGRVHQNSKLGDIKAIIRREDD